MITIHDLIKATPYTVNIDWQKVEEKTGFLLHEDLKNFYSRLVSAERIKGILDIREDKFIIKTGNERFDTWFSFNECEGKTPYELYPADNESSAPESIYEAFYEWTGGNDFGHRALIGDIITNMGEFLILFNNDTGNIEWVDCGYGYFEVYEENPNGIIAKNIEDFLNKLIG